MDLFSHFQERDGISHICCLCYKQVVKKNDSFHISYIIITLTFCNNWGEFNKFNWYKLHEIRTLKLLWGWYKPNLGVYMQSSKWTFCTWNFLELSAPCKNKEKNQFLNIRTVSCEFFGIFKERECFNFASFN